METIRCESVRLFHGDGNLYKGDICFGDKFPFPEEWKNVKIKSERLYFVLFFNTITVEFGNMNIVYPNTKRIQCLGVGQDECHQYQMPKGNRNEVFFEGYIKFNPKKEK